jgi:hypothetical protein
VREKVLVHEGMVGFGVFAGDADVFVLVVVTLVFRFRRETERGRTILKVTTFSKEISPALNFSTRIL